jgi:energy-coupling factor transport system ATP-binding protein
MTKIHEKNSQDTRIEFKDASYSYDSEHPAIRDINLEVRRGEFVCIIGSNGSGKSTLAKHINALLVPSRGMVSIDGMSTSDAEHAYLIRRGAGMVFQNPDSQIVASIVADDVAFGPENLGIPSEQIHFLVDSGLSSVSMTEYAQSSPANLSGGQKQRVSIAGILAMKPDLLILDEPGAMLDPRGRRGIRRVARELNEKGMTVVLITHFIEDTTTADRIFVMENGEIVASGAPIDIYTNDELLKKHGLITPFSIQLSQELRLRGIDIADCLIPEILREELAKAAFGEAFGGAFGGASGEAFGEAFGKNSNTEESSGA